ncbi:FHA domain-containing protein [Plantactinospora veratri]|uniref:FHA domain-containing protein n=1 Tax=Plantactinospora veratri TaxID=1436122 RepID=A0ABU7SD39_9ACTN
MGRFCEEDGYDFLLAPPVVAAPAVAAPSAGGVPDDVGPEASGPVQPRAEPGTGGPAGSEAGTPGSEQGITWQLVVDADPGYFDLVTSFGGTDAESLTFPRFVVPRRFTLEPRQLLIGRRSRSRGVQPDIDLVGPPEDPGVSHLHALLLPQPGGWAVVDLESANGTYLNDPSTPPIVANTPIPLGDGDRVYLGAWTRLTIRADR